MLSPRYHNKPSCAFDNLENALFFQDDGQLKLQFENEAIKLACKASSCALLTYYFHKDSRSTVENSIWYYKAIKISKNLSDYLMICQCLCAIGRKDLANKRYEWLIKKLDKFERTHRIANSLIKQFGDVEWGKKVYRGTFYKYDFLDKKMVIEDSCKYLGNAGFALELINELIRSKIDRVSRLCQAAMVIPALGFDRKYYLWSMNVMSKALEECKDSNDDDVFEFYSCAYELFYSGKLCSKCE